MAENGGDIFQLSDLDGSELIGEIERLREELASVKATLNDVGAIAKVGGWELNIATKQLIWTDETFRIFEVEKQLDQRPVLSEGLDLFTPDSKPIIERAVQRAIKFGEPYSLEVEALTAKGNVVWVYTNGKATYEDGKVVSLTGTIQDINSRKLAEINYNVERQKAEEALQLANERFQAAFYLSRGIGTITDLKTGRYIDVNEAWLSTLGYDRDEVIGKTSGELNIWGGEEKRQAFLNTLKTKKELSDYEATITIKNGEKRDLIINAVTINISGDELFLISGSDVTEQNQLEKKLIEAKSSAEAANKSKSEFLANMSHELRTPLNAIIGFSQIWLNESFGSIENTKYLEYAKDINSAGNHLLEIVNDILDISKIEAGEMEPNFETFDLDKVIKACLTLMKVKAQSLQIDLTHTISPSSRLVTADKRMIEQILINVVGNSLKFTPKGGAVSITVEEVGNRNIQIKIMDNGKGIPADSISMVLEPFGQVRGSSHITHEGTGLGLPLVKRMTELHGGSLSISSEVDKGTSVIISIPSHNGFDPTI